MSLTIKIDLAVAGGADLKGFIPLPYAVARAGGKGAYPERGGAGRAFEYLRPPDVLHHKRGCRAWADTVLRECGKAKAVPCGLGKHFGV